MTFHAKLNQPTKNNNFLSISDTHPTCLRTGISFCFSFCKHMSKFTSLLYGLFWIFLASGFDDALLFIKLSIPVTVSPLNLPVPHLRLLSIFFARFSYLMCSSSGSVCHRCTRISETLVNAIPGNSCKTEIDSWKSVYLFQTSARKN